jgi:hypothetical protein
MKDVHVRIESISAPETQPSIKRLRVICQKEKLRRENDLTRKHRAVSIYATWLLVRTRTTADQVTVASIATGLAAAVLLAAPGLEWGLAGVALLYASFLLDQVDGEVARFRRRTSLRGVYLDELRHLLIYAAPVFGLSFSVARGTGESWPFAVGFAAALGLALARIEPRLPALIWGERAAHLVSELPLEPEAKARDAPEAAAADADPLVKRALRPVALVAQVAYDRLAHQVLILLWLLIAVAVDRGVDRVFGGVGLEGLLLSALAITTGVSLLVSIVSHARPGEIERDTAERARETAVAARARGASTSGESATCAA